MRLEALGNLDLIGFAVQYGFAGLQEDVPVFLKPQVAGNGLACGGEGRSFGAGLFEKVGDCSDATGDHRLDEG